MISNSGVTIVSNCAPSSTKASLRCCWTVERACSSSLSAMPPTGRKIDRYEDRTVRFSTASLSEAVRRISLSIITFAEAAAEDAAAACAILPLCSAASASAAFRDLPYLSLASLTIFCAISIASCLLSSTSQASIYELRASRAVDTFNSHSVTKICGSLHSFEL